MCRQESAMHSYALKQTSQTAIVLNNELNDTACDCVVHSYHGTGLICMHAPSRLVWPVRTRTKYADKHPLFLNTKCQNQACDGASPAQESRTIGRNTPKVKRRNIQEYLPLKCDQTTSRLLVEVAETQANRPIGTARESQKERPLKKRPQCHSLPSGRNPGERRKKTANRAY